MNGLRAPIVEQVQRRQPSFQGSAIIAPTALQTTATTLFTANERADFLIEHLYVANVTGGALSYDVYVVPDGGSAATSNAVVYQASLAANTSEVVLPAILLRLAPEDSLQAICSSNDGINIGGWGYQQLA